jgi:anti-anti-sigma factor
MKPIVEKLAEMTLVIIPDDSLVSNNVAGFKAAMEELAEAGKKVVLDLSQVQFIDSAGCGALLQLHKRLREKGVVLAVCNISAPVRALFELVRIQRALDIYPGREQAVRAVRG